MQANLLPPDEFLLNIPRKLQVGSPSEKPPMIQEAILENEPTLPQRYESKNEAASNVQVLEKTDIEIEDSLPYHEQPFRVPMPFFPLLHYPSDEFRNDGSAYIEMLKIRANSYYTSKAIRFNSTEPEEALPLPPVSDCIGLMVQLPVGQIVIDNETRKMFPELDIYEDLCSVLNESYSPIYVLTKTTAYKVSAHEFLQTYKTMFSVQTVEGTKEKV